MHRISQIYHAVRAVAAHELMNISNCKFLEYHARMSSQEHFNICFSACTKTNTKRCSCLIVLYLVICAKPSVFRPHNNIIPVAVWIFRLLSAAIDLTGIDIPETWEEVVDCFRYSSVVYTPFSHPFKQFSKGKYHVTLMSRSTAAGSISNCCVVLPFKAWVWRIIHGICKIRFPKPIVFGSHRKAIPRFRFRVSSDVMI